MPKTYQQLRRQLLSTPAYNNPTDDDVESLDKDDIKKVKDRTLYSGDTLSRMKNAVRRRKRQAKIDSLQQNPDSWKNLE